MEDISCEIKKLSSTITATISKLKNNWKKSYMNHCKAKNSIEVYTYPCIFGAGWRSLGEHSGNFMNVENLKRKLPQIENEVENNKIKLLNAFSLRESILSLKKLSNKNCMNENCSVCYEPINYGFNLSCGHKFHHACIISCIKNSLYNCPVCRKNLVNKATVKSTQKFEKFENMFFNSETFYYWCRLNIFSL